MKNFIEKIGKIKEHPNGKMILFFGFYVIFFIVLFLIIGSRGNKNYLNQEYEVGNKSNFNANGVLNKNYFYDYKVTVDGVLNDYYGRRNKEVETFKYNNVDYYKNEDTFFMNNNGTWVKTDNPYLFYDILNVDNLELIMKNATLLSKTEYESGVIDYNYVISTNTINQLIYNINSDIEEVPNEIILSIDKEGNLNKIVYKLDSLCVCNSVCDTLNIELNYEMFGNVTNINNPIG